MCLLTVTAGQKRRDGGCLDPGRPPRRVSHWKASTHVSAPASLIPTGANGRLPANGQRGADACIDSVAFRQWPPLAEMLRVRREIHSRPGSARRLVHGTSIHASCPTGHIGDTGRRISCPSCRFPKCRRARASPRFPCTGSEAPPCASRRWSPHPVHWESRACTSPATPR